MNARDKAYAEGVQAKSLGVPVTSSPYHGSAREGAGKASKQEAHLRDNWFAGYFGEAQPEVPEWCPPFDVAA